MSDDAQIVTVSADSGESAASFADPRLPVRAAWRHRELLWQLTRREVVGRYRGSYLGILWGLITPLLTLAVFTLVFGAMHKNRWSTDPNAGPLDFPINLFIGIIVFGVFSEVVGRASTLIISHPNFVKKAVFPLELLGISVLSGALVHAAMTLVIELIVVWIALGHIPLTALLLPVVFVPAALITLGICWLLAALGVFFRDLGNAVGPVVQLLFFLTPIVYPPRVMDGYPAAGLALRILNPFVTIVESARALLIEGQMPNWGALAGVTVLGIAVAMVGYMVFMKSRRYFADAM